MYEDHRRKPDPCHDSGGEHRLTPDPCWCYQGPPGPTGPTGPTGPAGGLRNLVDGNVTGAVRGVGTRDEYVMGEYAFAIGSGTIASGNMSFASGMRPKATDRASHAEGCDTVSSALASHAEGNGSYATAEAAHAEGGSYASGMFSHAEGLFCNAIGEFSHAEGHRTRAEAAQSHAEGDATIASGLNAHAEGEQTSVTGQSAHAEGRKTRAEGLTAHAEGNECVASDEAAHAEGLQCIAAGAAAHAEGIATLADGSDCHAEGLFTQASGSADHVEGVSTFSNGFGSHAEGYSTRVTSHYSHAEGVYTSTASFSGVHIMGRYGEADESYSWFLANGLHLNNPGISAKILKTGDAYIDNAWHGGGADYAELYETESGQPIEPGFFVTFAGATEKVRIAEDGDAFVLGVTSAMPGFVAGAGELRWKKKFLTDEWGRFIYEDVSVPELKDKNDNVVMPACVESRPVLNTEYDPTRQYVPREKRPEWAKVALLGLVPVRDDGTAIPGGYCRPGTGGVATAAETGYRVVRRTGENQVLILFR